MTSGKASNALLWAGVILLTVVTAFSIYACWQFAVQWEADRRAALGHRMSDRWKAADMKAWVDSLRESNPELSIPDVEPSEQ